MKKVVLAFSGGLDTTFCAVYLREELGYEVITVTVDTGGFSGDELRRIEERAKSLQVSRHYSIDGRAFVYDKFISYIVKGNALRGNVYPLSVGAERVAQAVEVGKVAKEQGAEAVAHGSTGAGNDQIRFDVALGVLAPDKLILAPIRSLGWSRKKEAEWLKKRGVEVMLEVQDYSINEGLWGTTIGGKETHDSWEFPPVSRRGFRFPSMAVSVGVWSSSRSSTDLPGNTGSAGVCTSVTPSWVSRDGSCSRRLLPCWSLPPTVSSRNWYFPSSSVSGRTTWDRCTVICFTRVSTSIR